MENLAKHAISGLLFLFLVSFSGCGLLEDIFALGVWAGVIGVVILIIIVWIIVSATRR